jgi:hypothetical protein
MSTIASVLDNHAAEGALTTVGEIYFRRQLLANAEVRVRPYEWRHMMLPRGTLERGDGIGKPIGVISAAAHRPAATLSNVKGKREAAIAASERDVLAQLTDESFRAGHVGLRDIVGAVVQMLMRSDLPTSETFLCDHIATCHFRKFGPFDSPLAANEPDSTASFFFCCSSLCSAHSIKDSRRFKLGRCPQNPTQRPPRRSAAPAPE